MRSGIIVITLLLVVGVVAGWSSTFDVPASTTAGSFKFVKAAAVKGHPKAAYYLATYYYHGIGTVEDKKSAVFWFRKSADSGISDAQLAYGLLLLSGEGIPVDKAAALEWIGKAARQKNEKARQVLHELLTYQGSVKDPLVDHLLKPTQAMYDKHGSTTETSEILRLEGKGLLLDQGTFGLKFSLPLLDDPLKIPSQKTPGFNQMLERLQGGTFDIIIRPPQK